MRLLATRRGRSYLGRGTVSITTAFFAGVLIASMCADFFHPSRVLSGIRSPALPDTALLGQQSARQLQATGIDGDQQLSLALLQPQPAEAAVGGGGQRQAQQSEVDEEHQRQQQADAVEDGMPQQNAQQQQQPEEDLSGRPAKVFSEEQLRGAPVVYLSFANLAFSDFLLNWVKSVEALGLPYLVGALDDQTAELCTRQGVPFRTLSFGNPEDVRINFKVFRKIGAQKIAFVMSLLEDLGVQSVVVSDTDVVWLRNPAEYVERRPAADMLISTDCASHEMELAWKADGKTPICQAFNTGVFVVRNREASLAVLRKWREGMLNPNPPPDAVTDQPTLVKILTARQGLPIAIPEDPRTIWAANNTLKLHPLPSVLFAGGHTAFVQRKSEQLGVGPYSVHQTFLRRTYVHKHQKEFKKARFREFGIWFVEDPSYYEGRFLTYDNDVRQHVEDLERGRGSMQPLHKHWAAMAFQLALFRDALALARLTNRTLVLPPSWCWCDDTWDSSVIQTCHVYAVDLQPPFRCPADFVYAIHKMDAEGVPYRTPGFLDLPQVSEHVRRSRGLVTVVSKKLTAPSMSIEGLGIAAEVWPGIQASEASLALAPYAGAAVLHISGMQPGLFGGFDGAQSSDGAPGQLTNPAFDSMFQRITGDLYWCCTGFKLGDINSHWLEHPLPQPLAAGWQPWLAPQVSMPGWCKEAPPDGRDFIAKTPNHPCNFANLSAVASAGSTTGSSR